MRCPPVREVQMCIRVSLSQSYATWVLSWTCAIVHLALIHFTQIISKFNKILAPFFQQILKATLKRIAVWQNEEPSNKIIQELVFILLLS